MAEEQPAASEPPKPTELPAPAAEAAQTPAPAEAVPAQPPAEPVAGATIPTTETPASTEASSATEASDQAAIDELLKQANFEDAATSVQSGSSIPPETAQFELPSFQQVMQD